MNPIPDEYARQRVGVAGYRVLGLDLDGVCADYTSGFRDYCVREMGLPSGSFPDPIHYSLARAGWPFSSSKDYLTWHRRAVEDGLLSRLPAYPGVAEALQEISDQHVYIRVVSHRLFLSGLHHQIVCDTAAWLEKNQIPYMSLCFTGLKDSVEATVYVEDSPDQIETLRLTERGDVIVFDQPYNVHVRGKRIRDWRSGVSTVLDAFGR